MVSRNSAPIFIIDDDDSIRTSLRRLLWSVGYQSQVFANATDFQESISMASKATVILDVSMPGMSGFQLQERLCEFRSPMKIIFISGDVTQEDRERALARGAYGFLSKPFDNQLLLDLVSECQETTSGDWVEAN